jgi:hypothetical protein
MPDDSIVEVRSPDGRREPLARFDGRIRDVEESPYVNA